MQVRQAYQWLVTSERRKKVVSQFTQPLTARQMARRTELSPDSCGKLNWELTTYRLIRCLNEPAQRSRVYWLTEIGLSCQQKLRDALGLTQRNGIVPNIDWHLYGWMCFRHREAIIKVLNRPMRPPEIKRQARLSDPTLRMSANNVRDIMRLFLAKGIVMPVMQRRSRHPKYELSSAASLIATLLHRADIAQ